MRVSSIRVWGDSIAKGIIFDENRGRYAILKENAVELLARDTGLTIHNHSRMGRTAPEALALLAEEDPRALAGAMIVIEFGGNDCNHNWQEVSDAPACAHQPAVTPESFERAMENMVDLVRARGGKPVLCTLPPLSSERFLRWIARGGVKKENIMAFLGDRDRIYRWQEYYSSIVTRLAVRKGCRLIPVRERFLMQAQPGDFLCEDGMHPNAEGHRLIAQCVLKWAKELGEGIVTGEEKTLCDGRLSRIPLAI